MLFDELKANEAVQVLERFTGRSTRLTIKDRENMKIRAKRNLQISVCICLIQMICYPNDVLIFGYIPALHRQ